MGTQKHTGRENPEPEAFWHPLPLHSISCSQGFVFAGPPLGQELTTYLREVRVRFIFRASARALAPCGPMTLLRRLGGETKGLEWGQGAQWHQRFTFIIPKRNELGLRISGLMEWNHQSSCMHVHACTRPYMCVRVYLCMCVYKGVPPK